MKIDLHMHTIHSDGQDTILELAERVRHAGVTHVSITDHDTVAAYDDPELDALQAVADVIPGIEINSEGPQGELHILGYGIDVDHADLRAYCDWRKETRITWSQDIVDRLQRLGFAIEWERCMERATGGIIVRTHIAEELALHYPEYTVKQLYDTFLVKGKSAYVERPPYDSEQAIRLIQRAGGIALLAHPGLYAQHWSWEQLKEEGIEGVEAFHSRHTIKMTNTWLKRAKEDGLYVSVGSDYHGEHSRNPYLPGSVLYDEASVHPFMTSLLERKRGHVI